MTNRDIAAMKFRFFLDSNGISAQEVADKLRVSRKAVYAYRKGTNPVPDDYKLILEKEFDLNIYDVFYNPYFDKTATVVITDKEKDLECQKFLENRIPKTLKE